MPFLTDQFADYPRVHANRTNLLIHAVAVPIFDAATLGIVASAVARSPAAALACAVVAVGAFAAEGRGHALEAERPTPFAGPRNALTRIVAEQFITFPRYVLSGGWARAYRTGARLSPQANAEE